MGPESNRLIPEESVTVWLTVPLFVHWTHDPGVTDVSEDGVNPESLIETVRGTIVHG